MKGYSEGGSVGVSRRPELLDEIDLLERAIAAGLQTGPDLHVALGERLMELADYEGGNAAFRAALTLDGTNTAAAVNLARGLLEISQNNEAVEILQKAKTYDDARRDVLESLGDAYWALRKVDSALAEWQALLYLLKRDFLDAQLARDETRKNEIEQDVARISKKYDLAESWAAMMASAGPIERDLERLKKLAGGRPLYITAMHGRGWLLSHMVAQTEMVYRRLYLNGIKDPFLVVLNPNEYCNDALRKMYARRFCMVDTRYPRLLKRLIRLREWLRTQGSPIALPVDPENPRPHERANWRKYTREFLEVPPALSFTSEEERRGKDMLAELGIEPGEPFVAMAWRQQRYYREAWTERPDYKEYWEAAIEPDRTLKRAQVRVAELKHTFGALGAMLSIDTSVYIDVALRLAEMGLKVVRMGTGIDEPLPSGLDPRIIDYATKFRTDFGDVYAIAKAKFILSGDTGIVPLAMAFARPTVMCDFSVPNVGRNRCNRDIPCLFLPRKYWIEKEKRFLTFAEMLDCCRRYQWQEQCDSDGVKQVLNTAEEIFEVADEMNRRIDKRWTESEDDEVLQQHFLALYRERHEGYRMTARIGANFIRRNRSLIF